MVPSCLKVIVLIFAVYSTNGFNISPHPNLVFRESDSNLTTFLHKVRSSYFGFSINLRKSSVIIGAPRAQSTRYSQRNVNETGAIYKCSLAGSCIPYIFDEGTKNRFYQSLKKDFQWLGASIDGGPKDTDKLIVCAPRLVTDIKVDYHMKGICYWIKDTLSAQPQNVMPIVDLFQDMILYNGNRYFYQIYAGQGISAHITDNNEEILIGAPGIHNWKGTLIRYHTNPNIYDPGRRSNNLDYMSEVPNPGKWHQTKLSYFGYAISSGYFNGILSNEILYIATAPHANRNTGEAYIFDIVKTRDGEFFTIRRYFTFYGTQFYEFYGYAVLAEDLNGDGLTDVIITAPQYSSGENVDQGAIYVYINKGRLVFELQKKILSPINGKGRFGTSISRLGDINHDGYNDIVVGAPFADNGVVFIYLGSANGLREVHSQKLSADLQTNKWGQHMFGHGLSKGADIDNNGFNDLAIGAPNAEYVYVYRAYPVVKIHASIHSLTREIQHNQNQFLINICHMISTTSTKIKNQDLAIRVRVDPQIKRVTLKETSSSELAFNVTAGMEKHCRLLEAMVKFKAGDVFKPIELEMHYGLVNGVPNSGEFCDKCAALDPAEPTLKMEKIIFSTGCKSEICIADLKVKSLGLNSTYLLGSSRTIDVTYNVSNTGETAYLPQINITSSKKMPFAKIPQKCIEHQHALICDLNRGLSMGIGSTDNITIVYDVSQIEGTSMILYASVSSTGKELNPSNNLLKDFIILQEFTEIEAFGKPYTPNIQLDKVFGQVEIINNYEIKSNGPSRIQELEIIFEIPIAYKFLGSNVTAPIIDINNLTIQGIYDSQPLAFELFQDQIILLENSIDSSISSVKFDDGQNSYHDVSADQRSRRDVIHANSNNNNLKVANKTHDALGDELIGTLPKNRTVVYNCNDSDTTICVRAVIKVYNFNPDMSATITLKYHVDLKKINEILMEPWEFFVIVTKMDIVKVGDTDGKTIKISKKMEYNVISKNLVYVPPLWVIILSALGGLLVLAAIVYGMNKIGFFRRKTKEEMDKLIQEQQEAADVIEEIIKAMEKETEHPEYPSENLL